MSIALPGPGTTLPSVDRLLREPAGSALRAQYGHAPLVEALRAELARRRAQPSAQDGAGSPQAILASAGAALERAMQPSLRRVFNLTGTVLHTNLGRAVLPPEAIAAISEVAGGASNVEFDLDAGARGDRDNHIEEQIKRLTGAQAATVVNNNAAAVLLLLASLAQKREVPTSRGELIEIGGAFRLPDIMARAGCRLREVGTTNRTHLRDYAEAIGPRTGLVMKVHPSNYVIEGFTATVPEPELAALCRERGVPFAVDLGAGTLVDLRAWGLPHEPTPAESIAAGADLVTFSGDKLLGGPQAGIIAGRADLIAKIKRNPLKRALRVDKLTIAALAAVLRLYDDPQRLCERLPTLRLLARPQAPIRAGAARLAAALAPLLGPRIKVEVIDCESEIGSGAQPARRIPSAGMALVPEPARGRGAALKRLARALRDLPVPVIGYVQDDALRLDCRCLEEGDEAAFLAQLGRLREALEANAA
jgi:L-seryl-tRNA(Ser) seleniumtransferase